MYIKIWRFKQYEREFGITTLITHVWLYKDDDKLVKRLKHTPEIMAKFCGKIDVTIPEIQDQLKEHEIDKLLPPRESVLFDHIPLKWLWERKNIQSKNT